MAVQLSLSTLVQVLAWCHRAPSHYLCQCWQWKLCYHWLKGLWQSQIVVPIQCLGLRYDGFYRNFYMPKYIDPTKPDRPVSMLIIAWRNQSSFINVNILLLNIKLVTWSGRHIARYTHCNVMRCSSITRIVTVPWLWSLCRDSRGNKNQGIEMQ